MAWSYTRATSLKTYSEGAVNGIATWCHFNLGWTATQIHYANTSNIKIRVTVTSPQSSWDCGCPSGYTFAFLPDTLTCNGTKYTLKQGSLQDNRRDIAYETNRAYTVDVTLPISCIGKSATFYILGESTTVTINAAQPYQLTVSAGTGATVSVNRTTGVVGSTGALSSGAYIYKNEKLQISFTASNNYAIETHTVNGSTFASGGEHTVTGNVSVIATAAQTQSLISATNTNIGSNTSITVTKYNSSYTHTITYSFGSLAGQVGDAKRSDTSISWTVPTAFYAEIPNAKTGTCTLTCTTYDGNTNRGQSTCTFTVTASESSSAPTVSGTVVDTNSVSVGLTGNSSKLVKNLSTAHCTITATARNSSSISQKKINDTVITGNTKDFENVTATSFVFSTTDSRGYSATTTVTPSGIVNYTHVTINPDVYRPSSLGTVINMTFDGSYFNGSFGAYSNSLTIRYRYRVSTESEWSSWTTIASSNYTFSSGNKYGTTSAIALSQTFDTTKAYTFEINAKDIANGQTLTNVTKVVMLSIGVPVFDWGKNDFNFSVPVTSNSAIISGTWTPNFEAECDSDGVGFGIVANNVDLSVAAGTQTISKRFRIWVKGKQEMLMELFGIRIEDGRTGTRLQTHRKVGSTNYYNSLSLYLDDEGNRTVSVTSDAKPAWREALGLGTAATQNVSDMYVVSNITADNITVSGNSFTSAFTVSCTKSGYTAMGILTPYLSNATTSGQNSDYAAVVYAYIDGSLIRYKLRSFYNAPQAKVKVTFPVLWRKNT